MSLQSLTGALIVCIALELIEENEDAGAGTAELDTVNGMSGCDDGRAGCAPIG